MESFRNLNKLNKLKTAGDMLMETMKILSGEGERTFDAFKNGKGVEHVKNLKTDLIFKLGLGVSGTKLESRFQFKTKYVKDAQLITLHSILSENKNTLFGSDHKFQDIKTVEDFQRLVPVQTYESLAPYIEKHVNGVENALVVGKPWSYATTSGTTGKPKYIPITERAKKSSHQAVSRLWAYTVSKERPESFSGKILAITSPAEEGKTPDGTIYGSTSGQLLQGMSKAIKQKYVLPYEVLTIEDYDSKYYCILILGMQSDVSFISTANPSTLTLLAKKGNELKDKLIQDIRNGTLSNDLKIEENIRKIIEKKLKANPQVADQLDHDYKNDPENKLRPKHYWPNLVTIACWTGGNSNSFLRSMKESYGDVTIKDLGYLASEIRGTVPLSYKDSAGVLTITENFFEFVALDDIDSEKPTYLTCDQLKDKERYYIFFTTRSGLYRYHINDIVEVKGYENNTPKIIFIQKGKGVTNITGEKLYEQQLMSAIKTAEEGTGINTSYYMALAKYQESKYELYTEFADKDLSKDDKERFIKAVEFNLKEINMEYKAKRASLRLPHLILKVLADDSFQTFKKWRISQGIREAQFKTVPLTNDIKLITPFEIMETICVEQ